MTMVFLPLLLLLLPLYSLGLAIQSGPDNDGKSNAGEVTFDPYRNELYITGATTGSFFGKNIDPTETNCFLGTVKMDTGNWVGVTQLGNANVAEACTALVRMDEQDKLFVAGASLEGGVLSTLRARGSEKSTVYGMILQMNLSAANSNDAFALEGGRLLHESAVQYAISMTRDTQHVYVASIVSDDISVNGDYHEFAVQMFQYGTQYRVWVEKFRISETLLDGSTDLQQTLLPVWDREIGTSYSVYVGGILYMGGSTLLMAGTTQGTDDAFPDQNAGEDHDGFVTQIDAMVGTLTNNSYRIESQPDRTDRVLGVCKQDKNEQEFYVVGLTTGNLHSATTRDPISQAFLMKLTVVESRGFSMEWAQQVGAENGGVQGIACAVTDDGSQVYMTGRVDSGASIGGAKPIGGVSVFVAQMETTHGNVNFVHQIASFGNEHVSSIATDAKGNAIVYGSTDGSLYRSNPDGNGDVFLLSVDRTDGSYEETLDQKALLSGGTQPPRPAFTPTAPVPTAVPPPAPAPTTGAATPTMTTTPPPAPTPVNNDEAMSPTAIENQPIYNPPLPTQDNTTPQQTTQTSNAGDSGGMSKGGKVALSLFIILVILLIIVFLWRRIRSGKDKRYADKDHVVEYLKGFDDVEIDVKQSATGGWHGTYLNPRYASDESYSYSSPEVRFEANDSYVRNSLFMDDYETPSLGGVDDDEDYESDERQGLTKQKSNYDGLVDAYNTTWDDLSPHTLPSASTPPPRTVSAANSSKRHVMETIDFMRDDDEAWGKEII